ncbi:MAG: SusC/RagA family TonB-linked outer membrane protein [Cyclobacteriaceae bacterium]|nr:MAG: SusC/RagA family TonB-linked outer membrane protein [Cyclobacteriaceae bacterium]
MQKFLPLFVSVIFSALALQAQERVVRGKVTSAEDGSPLPGVNVIVKGTTVGTSTDSDGNYSISVPASGNTLVFSFIGLLETEVAIGARTVIDVQMQPDVKQLSEIVITGYGTTLKKEFSGSAANISSENISKLPSLSVNQALQGQASGVMVTANSGTPGGGISVRVRGQSTINGNSNPLYVIDGVPVVADNISQDGFGGQVQNALAGLNPQDIERIEVLKDASTTAIYGTRGANGVVLITTKRGQAGKSTFNVNVWTGVAEPTNTVKKVSAREWVDIKNEARVNSGLPPLPDNAYFGWDGVTDTDWINEVFRKARISEYQLNAQGGDERTRYYFSGSYRDEEGTMIGSSYRRGTIRLNLDHKASEIFSFGTSLFMASDLNQRIQNDNNIYGIYSAAILTPPLRRIRDDNGNYLDALPTFNTNPVRDALLPRFDNKTNKFIGNLYTDFKIMDGLNFRTDFSYDWNTITEDHYAPASTAIGRPVGDGNYNYRQIGTYIIEPTLRYAKNIGGVHSLNAVVGSTFQDRRAINSIVRGNGFAKEELTYLTSAATIYDGTSNRVEYSLNSVFGRINYAFKEKYLASVSVRRDGSSRFGANQRFGTFYAFSAGWNFSDEAFMENINWLSLGKLRASYGTTGNDGIGDFRFVGAWSGSGNYLDQPAFVPTQIENKELRWENTSTLDVGLELSLFNNRLDLNIGYFKRNTKDLLFFAPLPQSTGFNGVWDNIGEIENKGVEIDFNANVLSTSWGLKWKFFGNISFLRNKVVSLVDLNFVRSGFASIYQVGKPLNTFWGLKFLGVDPATGESIWQDTNNDGVITVDDETVIGDHQPDYLGGFTNSFTYKGFTLDIFFQFVQGVDIYNNTLQFTTNPAANWGMSVEMRRRWRQPGDITDIPKPMTVAGLNGNDNSRFISDGSYLRLKNILLAYDLPASLVSKAKLRNVRVYVSGMNLLTFTRYNGADPEVSVFADTNTAQGTDFLTFPQSKLYQVGLNIGF